MHHIKICLINMVWRRDLLTFYRGKIQRYLIECTERRGKISKNCKNNTKKAMKWYDYSPMALPFVARKRNIPGNISKFPGISPTQLSQVMENEV